MRNLTYEPGLVKSFASTILYLALVYYLIKFIVIYFKRLFVTVILILLGPFMGIKFAIDRLKFKSSSAFTNWAKEYIFSVGTQTIHALVYTIFVSIAFKILKNSNIEITLDAIIGDAHTSIAATCILAFMFFRFMTEAEKLLRGFLKLTGDSSSSIMGDADSTDIKEIIGWPIFMRINRYLKITPMPGFVKRKYESGKKYMRYNMESEYVKMRRSMMAEQYGESYKIDERGRKQKVLSDVDVKIDKILKAEFKEKLDSAVGGVNTSWEIVKSTGKIVIGLPVAVVENTVIGTASVATGIHTVYSILGNKIDGYKKFNEESRFRANSSEYKKMEKWLNANATKEVAEAFREQYIYNSTKDNAKNTAKLMLLHQARKSEVNPQNEIAKRKEDYLKDSATDKEKVDSLLNNADEASKIRLQNELAKRYRRNLKRNVEDALKTVDRSNIQSTVKEYMRTNNKYTLTFKDMKIIAESFDVKFEKGKMTETDMENQVEIEGLMEDQINEQTIIAEDALDEVENNIIKKMKQTDNEEEKRSMSLAIKCVQDKRHEINGEKKENVFSNLSEEEQNKVKGIIKEATDDETIEKHVGKMEVKEIVDTMKKAVDKEGSIKPNYPIDDAFKPIIEEVYHLKEVNELAKETTGEPIYKDIGKLVENMMNNANIKLDAQKQK